MENNKHNKVDDDLFDQVDYYLSRSRALVTLYLAERGLTHEMLLSMPGSEASLIYHEAYQYASAQMARYEALLRLGQRDTEAKPEHAPKHRHIDRLAHRIHWSPK